MEFISHRNLQHIELRNPTYEDPVGTLGNWLNEHIHCFAFWHHGPKRHAVFEMARPGVQHRMHQACVL